MGMIKDLTGQRFGRLVVLEFSHVKKKQSFWLCLCECKQSKVIGINGLTSGDTKSCGCLKKETTRNRSLTHGFTSKYSPILTLYHCWNDMNRRCFDSKHKSFKHYGGRGITVCHQWEKIDNFLMDMEKTWKLGLSLDRIDNNGNYKPSNCRWATPKEQAMNSRHIHWIEFKGTRLSLKDWSEKIGMSDSGLDYRLRNGWSIEKALTTPVRKHK